MSSPPIYSQLRCPEEAKRLENSAVKHIEYAQHLFSHPEQHVRAQDLSFAITNPNPNDQELPGFKSRENKVKSVYNQMINSSLCRKYTIYHKTQYPKGCVPISFGDVDYVLCHKGKETHNDRKICQDVFTLPPHEFPCGMPGDARWKKHPQNRDTCIEEYDRKNALRKFLPLRPLLSASRLTQEAHKLRTGTSIIHRIDKDNKPKTCTEQVKYDRYCGYDRSGLCKVPNF